MNQHSRRAAHAKSKTSLISAWPEVGVDSLAEHRGEVVHMVCQHEYWCQTLHVGGGMLECRCSPVITYHLQPTLQ